MRRLVFPRVTLVFPRVTLDPIMKGSLVFSGHEQSKEEAIEQATKYTEDKQQQLRADSKG